MKIYRNQELGSCNTLQLQAYADARVTIEDDGALVASLDWARKRNLPVIPLGEGSNIVLAGDLDALVVLQRTRGIEVMATSAGKVCLRVAAGENWHALVHWTLQQGYYGLENLALIPGTVGAAPIQNIGAYGVELQSVFARLHARKIADGKLVELDRTECEFSYRDSVFKRDLRDQFVITAVDIELSLQPDPNITYPAIANYFLQHSVVAPTPQQVFDAVVAIRRSKLPDPITDPNAGSFFKNPLVSADEADALRKKFPVLPVYPQADGTVKVSAGWMIDQCGWKGFQQARHGVHSQHALVLVNYGNESGVQLLSLAREIASAVHDAFGVQLEIEPRIYGLHV